MPIKFPERSITYFPLSHFFHLGNFSSFRIGVKNVPKARGRIQLATGASLGATTTSVFPGAALGGTWIVGSQGFKEGHTPSTTSALLLPQAQPNPPLVWVQAASSRLCFGKATTSRLLKWWGEERFGSKSQIFIRLSSLLPL